MTRTIETSLGLLLVAGILSSAPGAAAGERATLELARANTAVGAAIAACRADGYAVAAAVVDRNGELIAYQKGDGSTPHTSFSSMRKAYTVATLGPIFKFHELGAFVTKVAGKPEGQAIASLPDILLLAGAAAIVDKGEIVGAVGVGGAPGGDKDEACAKQAVAALKAD